MIFQARIRGFMVKFRSLVVKIQRSFRSYIQVREARISALIKKWTKSHPRRRLSIRASQRDEFMIPSDISRFFIKLYIKLKIWEHFESNIKIARDQTSLKHSMSVASAILSSKSTMSLFRDTDGFKEIQVAAMQNRYLWEKISKFHEGKYGQHKMMILLPDNLGFKGSRELFVFSSGHPVGMHLKSV